MASWSDGRGHGEIAGQGNAYLGKYYGDLGLTYDQIGYLTKASPTNMTWLSYEATKKYDFKNMTGEYPVEATIPVWVHYYFPYSQQSQATPQPRASLPFCPARLVAAYWLCALSNQMSGFDCRDRIEERNSCVLFHR
jgi:hypothetical protein